MARPDLNDFQSAFATDLVQRINNLEQKLRNVQNAQYRAAVVAGRPFKEITPFSFTPENVYDAVYFVSVQLPSVYLQSKTPSGSPEEYQDSVKHEFMKLLKDTAYDCNETGKSAFTEDAAKRADHALVGLPRVVAVLPYERAEQWLKIGEGSLTLDDVFTGPTARYKPMMSFPTGPQLDQEYFTLGPCGKQVFDALQQLPVPDLHPQKEGSAADAAPSGKWRERLNNLYRHARETSMTTALAAGSYLKTRFSTKGSPSGDSAADAAPSGNSRKRWGNPWIPITWGAGTLVGTYLLISVLTDPVSSCGRKTEPAALHLQPDSGMVADAPTTAKQAVVLPEPRTDGGLPEKVLAAPACPAPVDPMEAVLRPLRDYMVSSTYTEIEDKLTHFGLVGLVIPIGDYRGNSVQEACSLALRRLIGRTIGSVADRTHPFYTEIEREVLSKGMEPCVRNLRLEAIYDGKRKRTTEVWFGSRGGK